MEGEKSCKWKIIAFTTIAFFVGLILGFLWGVAAIGLIFG
jgi:hypothetical protein